MADKKGNIFTRIAKAFSDVIAELKRVTWPTREKLTKTSAVVLLVIVFFAVYLTIIGEIADLQYHLLVLMVDRGITIDDVEAELRSRRS